MVGIYATVNDQYINGLVQDCSNSSALAMELLQSCAKSSLFHVIICARIVI